MNLKEAIATVSDFLLYMNMSNFRSDLQCTGGEHDGKTIRVTVSLLCNCEECVMERVFEGQGICPGSQENEERIEPEMPIDEDDDDGPGEQWKKN